MIRVSACMIVKDEEEMLPGCLGSIKGLCDEIVVVDTGSTDKTVEIAKSYGAKVYHHPWEDSFSMHRNQAFGYASGDWFFVIDADERLVIDNLDPVVFKSRLAQIPKDVGALVLRVREPDKGDGIVEWLGIRFFRREARPKYKHAVHNRVEYQGLCAGSDLVLMHYGYSLSPEKMAAKHKRTKGLLQKRLDENPNDYDALFYTAQLSLGKKDWRGLVDYTEKCLRLLPISRGEDLGFYGVLYFYAGLANIKLAEQQIGKDESALKEYSCAAYAWLTHGLNFFPDDMDLNFAMALYYWQAQSLELFKRYAEKYFAFLEAREQANYFNSKALKNKIIVDKFINRTVYTMQGAAKDLLKGFYERHRAADFACHN